MNLSDCAAMLSYALRPYHHSAPVMMHTALHAVMVRASLDAYLDAILGALGRRPLLLPTFNYDYYETRVFDVENDPCQVGTLNEHARHRRDAVRTWQPVYSFAVFGALPVPVFPQLNPLGSRSMFAAIAEMGGAVAFWGAGFDSCTFLHHVEEVAEVPYRHDKFFPGRVRERETFEWFILTHHRVRPLDVEVEVDWARLERELTNDRLLDTWPLGRGKLRVFNARRVKERWLERLNRDPLYFLTAESRGRDPHEW